MVSNVTIHCDCGTDIRAKPTDGAVTCPDCESAFVARIITLTDTHASSPHHGIRTYRGP